MDYTEKYHLPQWKKEDRIMMEDFNEAMAGIENGLADAKGTADAAKGLAAAAYSPSQKPYVTGSYVRQDKESTVNLGFRPSFVICSGTPYYAAESMKYIGVYTLISAGNNPLKELITFQDTGFTSISPTATHIPKWLKCSVPMITSHSAEP